MEVFPILRHFRRPALHVFFPHYDKQKDIYADILKELDEASAELNASLPDEGFAVC